MRQSQAACGTVGGGGLDGGAEEDEELPDTDDIFAGTRLDEFSERAALAREERARTARTLIEFIV